MIILSQGKIVKYANESIILLEVILTADESGGCPVEKKGAVVQAICNFGTILDMKEFCSCMHPNVSSVTWHNKFLKIRYTLDFRLASNDIINQIQECKIITESLSDHAEVFFSLLSKDCGRRGPGFFKFNNFLLEDKTFIEELEENIEI